MRIQKVNEHMVRIFISFTELADRDITMTDLFQRTSKTEQLFWELIAQAREEVEFNLDQPFWIQATVSSNDEFVITVMKQEEQFDGSVKDKEKKRTPRNRIFEWVYAFADFEDVLAAAALLPKLPQLRSALYELDGTYYLSLQRMGGGVKRQTAESILDEYGELVSTTRTFLSEHGRIVLKNSAVETLLESFFDQVPGGEENTAEERKSPGKKVVPAKAAGRPEDEVKPKRTRKMADRGEAQKKTGTEPI